MEYNSVTWRIKNKGLEIDGTIGGSFGKALFLGEMRMTENEGVPFGDLVVKK